MSCASIHARPAGPFHRVRCSFWVASMTSMAISSSGIPPSRCTVPLQVDLRSRMKDLDISEVARRSGVPASALRFYEQRRLISSIGRRGLRRLFDPGVLDRLALIALGRAAGFSLDE